MPLLGHPCRLRSRSDASVPRGSPGASAGPRQVAAPWASNGVLTLGVSGLSPRFLGAAEMSQQRPRAGRWPRGTSPPAVGGLAAPARAPAATVHTRPTCREAAASSRVRGPQPRNVRARCLPGHPALRPRAPSSPLPLRGHRKGSECPLPRAARSSGADVKMAVGSVTFLGASGTGARPPVGSRRRLAGSHPVVSVHLLVDRPAWVLWAAGAVEARRPHTSETCRSALKATLCPSHSPAPSSRAGTCRRGRLA